MKHASKVLNRPDRTSSTEWLRAWDAAAEAQRQLKRTFAITFAMVAPFATWKVIEIVLWLISKLS